MSGSSIQSPVVRISGDFSFITQKYYTKERPVPHNVSNVYIYHADKECYELNDGSGKRIKRTIELTLTLGKWFESSLVILGESDPDDLSLYSAKVDWVWLNQYDDEKMVTWSKVNTASVNLMDVQMSPNEAKCGRVHVNFLTKTRGPKGEETTKAFLLPCPMFCVELMTSAGWRVRAYMHRILRMKKLLPVPVVLSYYQKHGEGNLGDRFVFPYAWMSFPLFNPQVAGVLNELGQMQKKYPTLDVDWAWSHLTGSDIQSSVAALNIKNPNIYRHSKSAVRLMKNGNALYRSGLFSELIGLDEQDAFMNNINRFLADLQGVTEDDLTKDGWVDKLRSLFPSQYVSVDWDVFSRKSEQSQIPAILKAAYKVLNVISKLVMPMGEFVLSSLYAIVRGIILLPLTKHDLGHLWTNSKIKTRETYENLPTFRMLVKTGIAKMVNWGVNLTSNMFSRPMTAAVTIVKVSVASVLLSTGLWIPLTILVMLQYLQVKAFTFLMSPWFEKNGLNPSDATDLETFVELWGQF